MPALAQLTDIKEASSITEARYVEPSTSTVISPGLKIGHLFERNLKQPYILQRLTDRAYYFPAHVLFHDFLCGGERGSPV